MSRELISQLKGLKNKEIAPSQAWLKQNREVLLSQIKNNIIPQEHTAYENFWIALSVFFGEGVILNVVKPLAVLLIVALVGTSGWIATVDAAYESLPGDLLYSAKRVVEKTQITTVSILGNKKAETKLHAEFAKRRANEIKKVSVSQDPKKIEKVSDTLEDLTSEMKDLTNKLAEQNLAINDLKEIKKNTEQVKIVLNEVKDNLTASATSTEDRTVIAAVTEAKDMAKDVAVQTMEAAVVKHLEGDISASKEEIKQMLDETVKNTISDTLQKTESLVDVNNAVEAAKTEMKVLESTVSSSASTTAIQQKIENAASTTKQAALQTQEAIKDSDQKTTNLQTLLESDDLVGALNVVKEVTETNKTVEKIVDTAVKTVQIALPPVAETVQSATSTISDKANVTGTVETVVTTTMTATSTTVTNTTIKK